jgi:hypothetical protein
MNKNIILILFFILVAFLVKVVEPFNDPYLTQAKDFCENTYKGTVSSITINGKDVGVCTVPAGAGLGKYGGLEPRMCDLQTLLLSQACVEPF